MDRNEAAPILTNFFHYLLNPFCLAFKWYPLQGFELPPVILPQPEQDENQQKEQDNGADNGCLPGTGFGCGEQDYFVFDQVARKNVNKTLRY